jgi:hypothetical protein
LGPIEAKLLKFGERDGPNKPHAVVGFVLGAFGEHSHICCSFCTAIARVGASRVVSFWKMPPKHALALRKQKILRFWGPTAQCGWARLILDRFQDLVLSPGDSTAATREPDSDSHEHRTFIFSRHMAWHRYYFWFRLAGWQRRLSAHSCFRVPPAVLALVYSFGGCEKIRPTEQLPPRFFSLELLERIVH